MKTRSRDGAGPATLGDVFEVPTSKGFAYVQYTYHDPEYGELIRVLRGLFASKRHHFDDLEPSYFVFFPVRAAVRKGLLKRSGRLTIAKPGIRPRLMRRYGLIDSNGMVKSWVITDWEKTWAKPNLDPDECELSLQEIWSFPTLVEHIETGWLPRHECGPMAPDQFATSNGTTTAEEVGADSKGPDQMALDQLRRTVNDARSNCPFVHYLYFKKRKAAAAAVVEAVVMGLESKLERDPLGADWAVLVTHESAPAGDEVLTIRRRLEAVANRHGGEYDGWEAKTTRVPRTASDV